MARPVQYVWLAAALVAMAFGALVSHPAHGAPKGYVAVIVWHDVEPSKEVWFDTTLATFSSELADIERSRVPVISLADLRDGMRNVRPIPKQALVLTFDDNGSGICEHAFPLLQKYRFHATMFVHTNFVGKTTTKRHCTWAQLAALQHSGLVDIQSLTANHPPDLRQLSDADVMQELRLSAASIRARLGRAPFAFVYPEDNYDDRLARLVGDAGYQLAFTEDWGNALDSQSPFLIHRYSALTRFDQALRDVRTQAFHERSAPRALSENDPVIAAAGDIACDTRGGGDDEGPGECRMGATAELAKKRNYAAVLPLGDEQYPSGSLTAFRQSYARTWGTIRAPVHPVVGNHEYETPGANGYFTYFGAAAGDSGKGYYSFDVGAWHLIALNGNCWAAGGCGATSAQLQWLASDLRAHRASCTLAYWHQPRFSSGLHHSDPTYTAFWDALYAAGADVVLNGHDHDYERFSPQTPAGQADPAHGIREFVVGTGGYSHYPWKATEPNSEARDNTSFGILELTLHPHAYAWRFVPIAGGTLHDQGSGACHGPRRA